MASFNLPFVKADSDLDFFESKIRPIFADKCVKCHGPDKQKSGLRLDHKMGWQISGDRGTIIVPLKPENSLLIKAISYNDSTLKMPPDKKLSDLEIKNLSKWVKDGATDPRVLHEKRIGGLTLKEAQNFWSFTPLKINANTEINTRHMIDHFISLKLNQKKLQFSTTADKRTLIRRLYYDVVGLPPSFNEVEDFLNDKSSNSVEKVVDKLLSDKGFGENIGRNWLDLVRYADTAGENSDHPVPYAYQYRDYVINAFNQNKPYDQFILEQLAGDILAKKGDSLNYEEKIIATGYLAIARRFGHEIDKDMYLTHEDIIDTMGKSLLGLSLGCARCHDHKYDPISAKDYYSLYGIMDSNKFSFPGCEPKQMPKDLVSLIKNPSLDTINNQHELKLVSLKSELKKNVDEENGISLEFKNLLKNTSSIGEGTIIDGGTQDFQTGFMKPNIPVEINEGEMLLLSIASGKNHGADSTRVQISIQEMSNENLSWSINDKFLESFSQGNPIFNNGAPLWAFFESKEGLKLLPEKILDFQKNTGLNIWRNGDTPSVFVNSSFKPYEVWTTLQPKSLFMHPGNNSSVALGWISPIKGKFIIKGNIIDIHPGGTDGVSWKIEIVKANTKILFEKLQIVNDKKNKIEKELLLTQQKVPVPKVAYAVVETKGANAKFHHRGDPEKLGEEVPRRWLEVFGAQPINNPASSGREDLANWIISKSNPLTARVMVNRIWAHYFGKGIVKSLNDFGTKGDTPSHPELLDWLANEFIRSNYNIKHIHKLILLSKTYQQSSGSRSVAFEIDPKNEYYWRMDKRRLKAEEIRDSILVAGGNLDLSPGGMHPFPPESTWNFTQHNPFQADYDTTKRSVYLMVKRNRRHSFLGLFDGPDPNASTPKRQISTVPTQALYFMNDPFFHAQALLLATRSIQKNEIEKTISSLFLNAFQRLPADFEIKLFCNLLSIDKGNIGMKFPSVNEWAGVARVLLSSNEFIYLD